MFITLWIKYVDLSTNTQILAKIKKREFFYSLKKCNQIYNKKTI